MTDPTARDLIQRLSNEMELWIFDAEEADIDRAHCLVDEALTYLAQLEPDGPAVPDGREPASVAYEPSDDELLDFSKEELYIFDENGNPEIDIVPVIRAVLARYGHQSPQPIPLSERQPTEADCDKEGMCWAWNQGNCFWWEIINSDLISFSHDTYTHWLPHWALPVPQEVE